MKLSGLWLEQNLVQLDRWRLLMSNLYVPHEKQYIGLYVNVEEHKNLRQFMASYKVQNYRLLCIK